MANPKVSTLVDAFTGSSVDTARWNASNVGQFTLDAVNDQVLLNVGTTAFSFPSFGSGGPWDATNSSLYAQVTPAPNGNGGVQTILKLDAGSNNAVSLNVASGGQFKAQVTTNGVQASTPLPTYDPHQHRWWKFTEAGGSFVFAASPDGLNWTNLATMAYTFGVTAVAVYFQTGTTDTEPSGMVAAIAHVNTLLGGQLNPNWPLIEDAWAPFWNANAGDLPLDRYVEVTDRTRGTVSVNRGRQYELDQVRAGEASLTLANTDAALDPTNTSGPWYGHIAPYQPYRRRAQWPPTRNLLDQVQATAGDLGGYTVGAIPTGSGGIAVFSDSDSSGGSIVATTSAWQGGRVFQFAVPSGTAGFSRIGYTHRYSVIPGKTYTVQIRARNITASTTLSVRAFIGSYTSLTNSNLSLGPAATLTGSASAGWSTLTATVTIPAGAGAMSCGLALDSAAAAAACSIQIDGWQLEKGSTATTWQAPGLFYPVFAGFVERWPSSWNLSGTYGVVQPTVVDAFSLLSQKTLSDPLTMEINSHSPRFAYRLDDPSGSMSATDWTGNNQAAPIAVSKYGAGSLTFGTTITSTDAGGTYTGSSGTVATLTNGSAGQGAATNPGSFISLASAGILGPAGSAWSRVIAFRWVGNATPKVPPATAADIWSATGAFGSLRIYLDSNGYANVAGTTPQGTVTLAGTTNIADGNWHLLICGYSNSAQLLFLSVDGGYATTSSGGGGGNPYPASFSADAIGGYVNATVGNSITTTYAGDVSFAVEFPTLLSTTDCTNLYTAWRSACAGESSNARYARILRYAGYTGPYTVQSGLTTSMGPAAIDGQDAVSALNAVVETENGEHFVDRSGFVQFRARSARYNATTPVYTFGERADLGEWPYEDASLDYDSTHLSNQVTVTQASTSQNFYAKDATSIAAYFPRSMSRTINSSSVNECQDAAGYLLSRYKQPATRVSSIKLHPSAIPALWPVCLSLELGTRVTVMRRPPGAPAIQVDCFLENIAWEFGNDGEAWVTLQCSPADLTPYAVFAAWHTTLAAPVTVGATTITVNASQDNVNPLATQLAAGQQLVLGQGSTNQETVTVAAVSATSSGWTTATITLTAAATKSHSTGDVVCEPLPAGVTDPTAYDKVGQFDNVAFAY